MNKHFLLAITVLVIISFSGINVSFAQDTIKKKPTVVKNAIPPAIKPEIVLPKNKFSQQPITASDSALVKDKSLNGQYQYLLTKLYKYQQPLVSAFWKNIKDTLTIERRQLTETKAKLAEQTKTINGLQTDVSSKDQTLSVSNAKRDEINFIGISFTKANYNLLMWGLVIISIAIAAVVIARSGAHSREAKYRIKLYEELDEEYRIYKAKANEKEKKLARELQTERNKLDELLGRS